MKSSFGGDGGGRGWFTFVRRGADQHRWARLALAAMLLAGSAELALAGLALWLGWDGLMTMIGLVLWFLAPAPARFEPIDTVEVELVGWDEQEDPTLSAADLPPLPPVPVALRPSEPEAPPDVSPETPPDPPPPDGPDLTKPDSETPLVKEDPHSIDPPVADAAPAPEPTGPSGEGAGDAPDGPTLRATLPEDVGPAELRFAAHVGDGIFGPLAARAWQEAQLAPPPPALGYGAPVEPDIEIIRRAAPVWPERARPTSRAPWCDLEVSVDPTGRVAQVKVLSCPPLFIPEAQAAAFATRFRPHLGAEARVQVLLVHFPAPP